LRNVLMVDVDGVLVAGRAADGRHLFSDLEARGLSIEKLQAEFFTPHWEAIVTGREGLMERLTPVMARIAPEITADELVQHWFENDAGIDNDVLEALRFYRAAGKKVFLATNQEHLRATYLMETLGLATDVDGIFYSAALGDRKPGAAFFRLAASGAGAKPAEIAFVDDSAVNVEAAKKAGWAAVQWTGGGASFRSAIDPLLGL
jgi:putative hydrolase of the HAD superfamily